MRGAWIEMLMMQCGEMPVLSLPVRGAWIEIMMQLFGIFRSGLSLPVRGAWIEMIDESIGLASDLVAPRAGSVD